MTTRETRIAVPGIDTRAVAKDELECELASERNEEPKQRAARDIFWY